MRNYLIHFWKKPAVNGIGFIEDAPERKNGEGFAAFYKEIAANKSEEYKQQFNMQEETFGMVEWTEEDLKEAFETCNIEPTLEDIKSLRKYCESKYFTDKIVEYGWIIMHEKIDEMKRNNL